jgi:fimbrial isopeptide formation D2 family protein
MFKKLVSNLPFNPSLIHQVGFYAERLKREQAVRRLSILFMVLAMFVQSFAVFSPAERSLAASSNHIINGLRTRADILAAWDAPGSDIPAIYGKFGVQRSDIEALTSNPNTTIKSNDGNDWWTTGRNSLLGYSNVSQQYKDSQVAIQFAGEGTPSSSDDAFVYYRQLRAWDIRNTYNTYSAFKGTISKTGETFWILVDCGNFTKIGRYTPPTPIKPGLEIRKTIQKATETLKAGESFAYTIEYRNPVRDSLAENVVIEDELDTRKFDVVSPQGLSITNGFLRYPVGNLSYTADYKVLKITVRLKDQLSSGTNVCNVARLTSTNTQAVTSQEVCLTVINPCPYDPSRPSNSPDCIEPKLTCSLVDAVINRTTRKVTFRSTVTSTNPATTTIVAYAYDYGDGKKESFNVSAFTHETSHTYAPGEYRATVTISYKIVGKDGTSSDVSCAQPISFDEDKPLGESKTVKNITRPEDTKKVQAGDVLEYTLTTTNSQNYSRVNVDITDYVGDILDYADIDEAFLKTQNGVYDKTTKKILWNDISIPGNQSVELLFRVTMKNPIPATNSPSSVSTDYDCKISNQYGNEITLDVVCPVVKGIETLPNTGPGTSMLMITGITTVVGYFFFRSRLLAKEIELVRHDYLSTGGM